jgi:hypothetical protein
MRPVRRDDLVDYQTWSDGRDEHLRTILEVKSPRRIHLGKNLTFLFENTETIRYQIQEMMRVEQIVREADIQHELDTYNELLGSEGELGCVLLIEIDDEALRAVKLVEWLNLPHHVYVVAGGERRYATFDTRQIGTERVSSVQYMKFDTQGLPPTAIGADHASLTLESPLSAAQCQALASDLAPTPT